MGCRPVAWSGLSTIFTAHPTKPCIVGRQFPSLKSFELPLPKIIAQATNSYNPPTIITVSSDNMWLFAFFPGTDVDGVGCIWARTLEADSWITREHPTASAYPWNAGVVAAAWINSDRQVYRATPYSVLFSPAHRRFQWKANATVAPYRLPTKGPTFPVSFPVLVIVTQSLHVEMWYLRARHMNFNFLRAALIHGAPGHELQPPAPLTPHTSEGGAKLCVTAAIGVMYDGEFSASWI